MLLGITGPVGYDVDDIFQIVAESEVACVNGDEIVAALPRPWKNIVLSTHGAKLYVLEMLQHQLGSLAVYSNVLLTPEVCHHILANQGYVCVLNRKNSTKYPAISDLNPEEYWGTSEIRDYELIDRFVQLHSPLAKEYPDKTFLVDVTDDACDDLFSLGEVISGMPSSDCQLTVDQSIEMLTQRRDGMSTIEESIRNAMLELGIDPDVDSPDEEESVAQPEVKKSVKAKEPKVSKPKSEPEPVQEQLPLAEETDSEDEGDEDTLFVKITDTSMALLIPEGMALEEQVIAGMRFRVATVKLPDWDSRSLQPLEIRGEASPSPSPKPIVKKSTPPVSKPKPAPSKPAKSAPAPSGDVEELKAQKAELDAAIKQARAAGDEELVNQLRKQRRATRAQINKLTK